MSVNKDLERLVNNRLMQTDKEIENFEEALENLASAKEVSIIPELCKGFDDNTDEHEVMFGLLHMIEDFEGLDALKSQISSIPYMIENNAKNWAKIMNYRILNSLKYRVLLLKAINCQSKDSRTVIISLLEEIKRDDPEKFGKPIDEVLSNNLL